MNKPFFFIFSFLITFMMSSCSSDDTTAVVEPETAKYVIGTYALSSISTTSGTAVSGVTGSVVVTQNTSSTVTIKSALVFKTGTSTSNSTVTLDYTIVKNGSNYDVLDAAKAKVGTVIGSQLTLAVTNFSSGVSYNGIFTKQ
ncbi:MAG: hypothetical protein ACOVOW_08805 [Spirosomataceae bacterium]